MNLRNAAYLAAAFVGGAALTLQFAQAFAPASAGNVSADPTIIAITPSRHQALQSEHAMDRWLDDELLFREALRRGYLMDDLIVRRELQQRTRTALLAEHPLTAPDDAALQAYLEQHAERYQAPSRWSFEQIYLSRSSHGTQLDADAQAVGLQLRAGVAGGTKLGDPFPGGARRVAVGPTQIVADFGAAFARAVAQLPADGSWHGPIVSVLGEHWVRVSAIEASRSLSLNEVRARVQADYLDAQKQQTLRTALDALRSHYRVVDDAAAPNQILHAADEDTEIP